MRSAAVLFGALAFAAAGCGGTTAQVGAGGSTLVPASAPAFISVDADPSSPQWRAVDALASKFPDKQKALDVLKSDLRKQDVDWDSDVRPVLQGEFDFVWLDFENDGQNFVGLLQPKNEAKFKQLVAKSSDKPVYDKFHGWYVVADKQATVDRFEQESNAATATLADDKTFTKAMDRLGDDSVLRAYVNGAAVMKSVRRYGGPDVKPYLAKFGTLDWIALRMRATSEGLGMDTIVHGTPGSLFKSAAKSAVSTKLAGTVPADALVYMSFHGAKGMFNGLEQSPVLNAPQFRQFAQPLQALGRILEGENALYARPGASIPEVTLVSTPSDLGTPILDRVVKKFSGAAPHALTLNGVRVHGMGANGMGLYYADVGGKFVVSDQLQGIGAVRHSGKSLADSDEFRSSKDASGMPDQTWSALYVNIHASVPYVEKLAQQRIPGEIARNLKPLRSAVEYAASHTHELQVTFFLRIE